MWYLVVCFLTLGQGEKSCVADKYKYLQVCLAAGVSSTIDLKDDPIIKEADYRCMLPRSFEYFITCYKDSDRELYNSCFISKKDDFSSTKGLGSLRL